MRKVLAFRWPIFILWIVTAIGLLLLAPNLQELVREKGEIGVPEGYTSSEASKLLNQMSSDNDEETITGVLVFHEDQKFTESQKAEIANSITQLQNQKAHLQISNILNFTEDPRIEEQVVSEDETTILVPMDISIENRSIEASREAIYNAVAHIEVSHLLTGEAFISQDVIVNSEEGVKKTEFITIAFILIILFIVFKSLVAPFIPLLTVGISYLTAQGIVAILADTIDFPLSTFTQIFMVAVMFGIGTDYCILLISRFKEELVNQPTTKDAVLATYKSAGKTILFAGLAVLIGFSTIGLSTFSLYQSAVAVAVGVAVVLIALPTLVPFFLVVLGKKLFWPFDKDVAHKESKLWGKVGSFAWARPVGAILIVLAIVIPSLIAFNGQKSYNSLDEIGENYDSVKAFKWIEDSIGPGEAMPTTVVMQIDEKITTRGHFQDIESITYQLSQIDGVRAVRSATRPTGEVIDDFTITNQTDQLGEGVGQSVNGITEIKSGLATASKQIKNAQPKLQEASDGVDQLLTGTQVATDGIGDMQTALTQIQNGIASGAQGVSDIKANLESIQTNLEETVEGNEQLLEGYQTIEAGLSPLLQGYQGYTQVLTAALQNLLITEANNPDLQQDPEFQTAKEQLQSVLDGTDNQPGLQTLNDKLQQQVVTGLDEANTGLEETVTAQQQIGKGLTQLIAALGQLETGLDEASSGQQQVVNEIPSLQNGLTQIYGGQEQLQTAFTDIQDQFTQLTNGLDDSTNGLQQISNGLAEVQRYLGDFSSEDTSTSVHIPEEALKNEAFIEGIAPYLSDDKKITTFEIVMKHSPYSTESLEMVDEIELILHDAVKGTSFKNAKIAIGGISSTNNDLQQISDADYSRTVILMLSGIFIVLIILLRSIIMPVYLIGSLIVTYFTAMGITEFIFVNGLGYEGISWAVSFFAFVILVALGIDYSIFLMGRFNENKDLSIKDSLMNAMKNMGTVIISAAVILGGTFAAMMPSGVLSLLQIATVVLLGLFLYALIMLPLFIPVMVRLFGKANWWPFLQK